MIDIKDLRFQLKFKVKSNSDAMFLLADAIEDLQNQILALEGFHLEKGKLPAEDELQKIKDKLRYDSRVKTIIERLGITEAKYTILLIAAGYLLGKYDGEIARNERGDK